MDSQYDEGFASSSSMEDAQTKDIIRRRRAQSLHRKKPSLTSSRLPADLLQTFPVDALKMALIERILWLLSFLWTVCRMVSLPNSPLSTGVLLGWTTLILTGLSTCHAFSRTKKSKQHNTAASLDKSSTETSSDDSPNSPLSPAATVQLVNIGEGDQLLQSDRNNKIKGSKLNQVPLSVIPPTNRIFGASRMAFRSNADDGLLCGVLLLPIVACAQLTGVIYQRDTNNFRIALTQAKLELTFLMSLIFLILVSADGFLHPVKRMIRKRGLFVSSILISGIFTFLITRLTTLTPVLGYTPIIMTIISVTTFQWSLYLCVVALKRCFTLGEMCVISEGAAVMVHKVQEMVYATFYSDKVPDYMSMEENKPETILIHAVVMGMLVIGFLSYPLLRRSRILAQKPYWRSSTSIDTLVDIQRRKVMVAISFYCLTATIIVLVISPICAAMLHQNPFLWTLEFLFSSPPRLFLCIYWTIAIGITVIIWVLLLDFPANDDQQQQTFFASSKHSRAKHLTSALNKKRKLFHGLAVVMFVPGVLFANSFLQLAFGVALSSFIYLEFLRYFAVWPYGKNLHMFLTEFIDNRDLGPVILSHIYLLVGCAVPVWLGSSSIIASLSGILSLGFGDALASIVGKRFGRFQWPGTKKTVEGTLAFIVTVYLSALIITYSSALISLDGVSTIVASAGRREWIQYLLVVTMTGLLEAFSFQNDNIIIPLYMYALVVQCQILS
ncbi:uncharacterized protein BX664DRAFT_344201 [Halteromyces radiatus]|uniref:uncharacterized protein n=1 Tax=Halteromyces radiatus TaxID=101107 RepID=UPI00221E9931|nr:uncharacterized protein BX664DRAFT_344201 [Halteromyces radiatus]KAI8076897.1 hypothetical protein BX664DRAFT_344201 [Halteromyces radiatus]